MAIRVCLSLLAILVCSPIQTSGKSAYEVIQLAAKKDSTIRNRRLNLEYDMLVTINTLNQKGEVVETRQEKKTMQPQSLITYSVDVDDTAERTAAGQSPSLSLEEKNLTAQFSITDMISRFVFSHAGKDHFNDMECFKIKFTPKPNQPYNSREEKIMNAVAGHVWIDKDSYSIVKTIGTLTQDVEVAWFFATMKSMDFTYLSQTLPNGDIGPAEFNLTFHVDATLFQIRRNQVSLFQNHRPSKSSS